GEGGPVTGARRGGGQGSAVGFNQCPGNGQADARTSVVPVAGAIATVEAFEDVAQLLRCHAFTGIGDFDEDRARTLLGGAMVTCPPAGVWRRALASRLLMT